MISATKPPYAAIDVYIACVRRTKNAKLKIALQDEAPRLAQRSDIYAAKAAQHDLHNFVPEMPVHVQSEQLTAVYDRVLVNGGERPLYDFLKSRARFRRCLLCGQRDVQTLDHHLPQAQYPELCVTPVNLVPCCRECNSAKSMYVPSTYDEQTFHPYFDDWSQTLVVEAAVQVDEVVSVSFSVCARSPYPVWLERAKIHFALLELGTLYSEHAAIELVQQKASFQSTYDSTGVMGLRNELEVEALSRSKPFPNAWQPALYRCLASSEEFYNKGFEKIEE